MNNNDWKKLYRRVDSVLATKYNIKPTIIHYIRVQSIKKNRSLKETTLDIAKVYNHAIKNDRHSMKMFYEQMLNFLSGLNYEKWIEITSPNAETYKYMLFEDKYYLHQKHIKANPISDK